MTPSVIWFVCHKNPLTLYNIKSINFLLCKEYQILQRFNREKGKFCDKIKARKRRDRTNILVIL